MSRHVQRSVLKRVLLPLLVVLALVSSLGAAVAGGAFDGSEPDTAADVSDLGATTATNPTDDPADETSDDATDQTSESTGPAAPETKAPGANRPAASPKARAKLTKADQQRAAMARFKADVRRELENYEGLADPVDTASFKIGTYNILGSNHKPNGRGRAATSAGLITSRGVDVIGLQEVQRDQQGTFEANMPGYTFWPRDGLGRQGYRHQIAWRSSMFEYRDGGSVDYTFTSMRIPMPWIRLRHLASGAEFYLINTHNSARNLEGERDSATSIEIALINELRQIGLPVFIVGDMNEHTEFFCRVSQATGMVAANGGSGSGGCRLPPPPLRVDWIMGVGASFSGYVQDGASIATGASDHYFLHANTTIEAVRTPESAQGG